MTILSCGRVAGALAPLFLLGGCLGSLLGGGKPEVLYRFGGLTDPPLPSVEVAPRRTLRILPIAFPAAAAGDRILIVDGSGVAYLKRVRWVSPASMLFREGVDNALARRAPDMVAADGTAVRHTDAMLTVDVNRFEASYDRNSAAPPAAHVAVTASLIDPTSREVISRRQFEHVVPAEADTVTGVVRSIDAASRAAIEDLVGWAGATVAVQTPGHAGTLTGTLVVGRPVR